MSDTTIYEPFHTLEGGHTSGVNAVAFSPTGMYLASGGDDHSLVVWSLEDGALHQRMLVKSPITALAWHPGRRSTLFYGCEDGVVGVITDVSVRPHSILLFS